jgi:hypothetical protein
VSYSVQHCDTECTGSFIKIKGLRKYKKNIMPEVLSPSESSCVVVMNKRIPAVLGVLFYSGNYLQ